MHETTVNPEWIILWDGSHQNNLIILNEAIPAGRGWHMLTGYF